MVLLIVLGVILLALLVIYLVEPSLYVLFYSVLTKIFVRNPPYVDVEKWFPNYKRFEENYPAIREEAEELLENEEAIPEFHKVDKLQRFISTNDNKAWRTFIFKGFDKWLPKNCEQAPRTYNVLKQCPEITLAMFSILAPGKHIPPHVGFFRGVFRYHLGVIIPEGDVFIRVKGHEYRWKEGESVLFDDTFRHEVWNKSDGRRVVLFVDVFRNESLPAWIRPINRWMFNIFANSKKLQEKARAAEVQRDIA
jgi:beta-hydroxylase